MRDKFDNAAEKHGLSRHEEHEALLRAKRVLDLTEGQRRIVLLFDERVDLYKDDTEALTHIEELATALVGGILLRLG